MSKTLSEQLRIKAGMMQMGEKIAWGSDTALMEQAATEIDRLKAQLAQLRKGQEAGGFFCPKVRSLCRCVTTSQRRQCKEC